MKVYVVHVHESCEGSTIIGVYSDKASAVEAVQTAHPCFGPWERVDERTWESGCDEVNIEECEVGK